jgi:hypothetical protein
MQDLPICSANMVGSFVERRPGKKGFEVGGAGVLGVRRARRPKPDAAQPDDRRTT